MASGRGEADRVAMLLSAYYGSGISEDAPRREVNVLDINKPEFQPDAYVRKLLKEKSEAELLAEASTLKSGRLACLAGAGCVGERVRVRVRV